MPDYYEGWDTEDYIYEKVYAEVHSWDYWEGTDEEDDEDYEDEDPETEE